MLFEENDTNYSLVLILIVLPRIDLLQEIACFAAVLSYKPSSISHEELSALVPEFAGSDVGIIVAFVEFSKDLLKGSSDVVVDSDIIRSKEEDVVCH